MRLVVIGVGQGLRGDDAAGQEVVRLWQQAYPETAARPGVRVESTDRSGLALLDLLDGVDAAVLVDAVRSSSQPGTLHRLDPDQLSLTLSDSGSSHGWGLAGTLKLIRSLGTSRTIMPIRLVGIEAAQADFGAGLSAPVQQALPLACQALQDEVLSFLVR